MKILQVIAVVSPAYGGPSIGSVQLNGALRSLGVDARILTTRLNGTRAPLSPGEVEELARPGADIVAFRPSAPRALQHSWALVWRILSEARTASAIHMHGQYMAPHVAAFFAARLWKVPYGIQLHGGLEPYQRTHSALRKKIYGATIGRRILRQASYVMFASASEASHASDVVRDEQVLIAPLGASLDVPEPVPELAEWLGNVAPQKVVLFLGRLARKKRPDFLLEEWARLDLGRKHGARLVIAGPDDDFAASELRQIAVQLGIADDVYFTGPLGGGRKAWVYRRAGVFALPSRNENFAITVAEAMLGECFVITTPEVAAHQYVEAAAAGAVLHGDETFGALLDDALSRWEATAEAARRGAQYASANLSWSSAAVTLAEKINRLQG